MTLREKIAQMQHPTFLPRSDGKIPSYLQKWCNREGIGMLLIHELNSVEAAANSMNIIQEYAEGSRLGVPIPVSMDSVHGLSYVNGATVTPHNLGLAATGDMELVTKLAEIAREEHIAIGVRMTLSPEADIATEPRWGRVMETFGENPDVVTEMVKSQIVVFQNGADGVNKDGIVACIKHFPGAGPQMDGKDTSPIVSDEESLQEHLKPYYAALEVNVGSVMPYYSVPLTLDMENSDIGSKATLQDLLRDQMGFEGIFACCVGTDVISRCRFEPADLSFVDAPAYVQSLILCVLHWGILLSTVQMWCSLLKHRCPVFLYLSQNTFFRVQF
ncbi:MAG: hypothetical protein IJA83_11850 [Clostridia bacterium]|nr:hypothetical protein [Clostridia bacterium]